MPRAKRVVESPIVPLPEFSKTEIVVPELFIYKTKSGKWKVAEPVTDTGALTARNKLKSIKVVARNIQKEDALVIEHGSEQAHLSDFSKGDKEKIERHFEATHHHKQEDTVPIEEGVVKKAKKERKKKEKQNVSLQVEELPQHSRPVSEPQVFHEAYGNTEDMFVPKAHAYVEHNDAGGGGSEGEEEQQAKKGRGRPKKYASAEEAKKEKFAKTVESNRRRRKEKKEMKTMGQEDHPIMEGHGLPSQVEVAGHLVLPNHASFALTPLQVAMLFESGIV